jgi:hypothetical protein
MLYLLIFIIRLVFKLESYLFFMLTFVQLFDSFYYVFDKWNRNDCLYINEIYVMFITIIIIFTFDSLI